MPIQECSEDGESGYKWGEEGKCYTYTAGSETSRMNARRKAHAQGIAFEFTKNLIAKLDYYIRK